ncbi:px domain protein [Cystoisospora suis]|uniref:Px domain protein n=1 Tax=Cystoisospora suis TaxID=483139 RepID=A0A2C6L339_9APIC|nr:px domain protein [Cystoisospora suis]
MLRNCMQRASAAKRQAVCSRNKWMEVEQLIAAAPQRRQQLEEQLAYRMRVLTRLQEKSTHQQMLLQQLRLEEQQRRERRQQEEVDARQIAAALEVFTAALRRRRHPPFTRLSSADIPSSSSLSVDLSNPSVSLPVASSSLASSVDSSGEWPALRPFVRLLPARLQHRPEILSLLSVSERKDEKRQEGGDEERDSYRSSKKEREKNISLRGNVSAPPLPPVSSSQGDQASLDMKEKEKSKENHVDKSHEQEGGFSRETKDTDEGLDIRMRFEVFLRRLLIEQQERAKRSHEGEGRRRRRGRGGEEDERRRRRRTTSGHGHSSHHNDHSKMKTSYGRSSTGLDKTKEDEEEEDEYDEDEEEEEEEEDGEIRVLEKQVYEVMKETEQHEAQVHQLERMIKEQTDRQTLLKKAEELQNEVRQCDSEVSLLISQEHSARRRYTREQEEAEKYEKLLTSREEERKVAKIALESQIQTLRQEEDLARKLLYQGEEELRGIWVLLQQIEKELRYVGLRRFYVDESLQEEQEDRQRLRDQVCRSLTALNDLRSTLDAIQDDDAIHTLSLSKRKKKKL